MKSFMIAGTIVDTEADKFAPEDVCVLDVKSFLDSLAKGEEASFEITSYGGSVPAGIAICNLLKKASAEGHKTTAHVIGIAASMASAIACACDILQIDANAFLMVHNPWTVVQGNAEEMRKEADVLDQFRDALLAVYRTKFDVSDDILKAMLDEETWLLGSQAEMFKLNCEVILTEEPLRAAAFAKQMPKFMHTPKAIAEIIMEKEEEKKQANDEVKEVVEEKADETPAKPVVEEPKEEEKTEDEPKAEEPKEVEASPTEMVAKAEADKRVSGMQSAMAKQMDSMKKDYEAKIADFKVQMQAKDEELSKVKAELTSLGEKLDKSNRELSDMTSALAEKTDALASLNASVNTPNETTNWKSLKGKEFFDWYRKTH